ncbi:MAG: Gfo/Idh/MocA family protein [Armatimonadota bacterium]
MTPVKIGMMSFAHMHAYSYAAALKKLDCVEFVGIADDDKERAAQVGKDLGVPSFAEYEDLLNTDVQGIIVCSENIHHRRHVVVAAQHDKHVMCEKPLSTTNEDAEAMIEVCKRANVKLLTAFPCRFHPAFTQLKHTVDSGELGKILAVRGTNQGQCPWGWFVDKSLSGGGAVIDHTVHVVDLMRCMTGAEPTRVYAEIDNRMFGKDFDDTGILTIEFSNGMYATLDASWSRPKSYATWGNVKMAVVGTDGIADMDMFGQIIEGFYDKSMSYKYEYWGEDADLNLVASFAQCIADDTPPEVTGEDGAKALAVALAAYESAKTGKPVSLI